MLLPLAWVPPSLPRTSSAAPAELGHGATAFLIAASGFIVGLMLAYSLSQIVAGETRQTHVRGDRLIVRATSFARRLVFLLAASLIGCCIVGLDMLAISAGGFALAAVAVLLSVLLVVIAPVLWLLFSSRAIFDRTSQGTFIRGRRSLPLSTWQGITVAAGRTAQRGGSSRAYEVQLVPTDTAMAALGGAAVAASLGRLAAFADRPEAESLAGEVARFTGLPLLSHAE